MAVVARNERSEPYWFVGSDKNRSPIAPGEIKQITERELDQVPVSMRGPGGINVLWPTEVTSDTTREMFDYYVVGTSFEVRYIGFATQDAATSDPVWTIKRLSHQEVVPTDNRVVDIQTLSPVAWDDRATLPWT